MASSSSITPSSSKMYDVFLSFRGDQDTPHSFATHLYDVLRENNISTFKSGNEISPALLPAIKAIKESRISLIIISRNYANSSRCLEELVTILECREKYNQIVIPVYYDIDPSDVRHQTGPFADAFKNHEAVNKVSKWRDALKEATNLPGYRLLGFKSEAALTRKIVDGILKQLGKEVIREPKPSGSNIGESDSSHKDEEADGNKDTGEQNRGGGGDGGDGGGEEAIHDPKIPAEWFQWITEEKWFQWITVQKWFVAICFILELPSAVFDKLSSEHKPRYVLVSMVMSILTMLICIIQLVHQCRKRRVGWKQKAKILWPDFVGLFCVILQSIFTAIDYGLHLRNINDPIALSIWPIIFSFCTMFSTFFKEFPKEEASTKSMCSTCSSRASGVLGVDNV